MKYLLFFGLLVLDFSLVHSNELKNCTKQELIEKENLGLRDNSLNNLTYNIVIFNEKIELPLRFELIVSDPVSDVLVFDTSLNIQDSYQKKLGCKASTVITGNIEIGSRKDCELCDEKTLRKNDFEITESISVKGVHYIESRTDDAKLGVIFNEENYMYVVDENKELAQHIYYKLSSQFKD